MIVAYLSEESWRSKFWRRLGFCQRGAPRPASPKDGFAEGWLIVASTTHFDWGDRLRILLSGKVYAEHCVQTDVVVGRSFAETAVSILPPTMWLTS